MTLAINSIAARAQCTGSRGVFLIYLCVLTGCAQPGASVRSAVYDFGPGAVSAAPASPARAPAPLAPLLITEIESSPALDSTAVLYRLAYADAQQLQAYAHARWSMTPAQLLRQRLRDSPGSHRSNPQPALTLHLELEEFSQLFDTPTTSVGLLRLRASVTQTRPDGEKWLAQRTFTVQRPAPSADAPGGVRALTAATDAAVRELDDWLRTLAP